LGWIEGRDGLT